LRRLLRWCVKRELVMKAREMQAIGDTLLKVVTPETKPKQLVKAVQREHPKATKKDIARAAFFAVITNSEDLGKAKSLQAFAISERVQ
jgi:hypothetical protein